MAKAKPVLVGLAGAAALMATVGPIIRALRQSSIDDIGRWRALSIDRPIEEISPGGQLPPALAALGSDIEVEMRSAPGDWSTEVAVRWVGPKLAPMRTHRSWSVGRCTKWSSLPKRARLCRHSHNRKQGGRPLLLVGWSIGRRRTQTR